jgi:hypothetical protein
MKPTPCNVDAGSIDRERFISSLRPNIIFESTKKEKKWYQLVEKIPANLRACLLEELSLGNAIVSIQYGNWPQQGSVVVSLGQPFKNDFSKNNLGVTYRFMNDPHYWVADVHQIVDGIEHLIIT